MIFQINKILYFTVLISLIHISLICGQAPDSTAADSVLTPAYQSYLPSGNLPGVGISQFGVKPKSDYSSFLKLGKPYRPKVDFHRMDLRGTSNYTPPWVQKGHLIDMGRDPGTFWLSPYTVALLGLAMLERYYLREQLQNIFSSPSLEPGNLFAAEPNWQIMEALWERSPQMISELSVNPRVGFRFRGKKLEDALKILADNHLIYSELLTNKTLQYGVVFDRNEIEQKIIEMLDSERYLDLDVRDGLNQILSIYYKE